MALEERWNCSGRKLGDSWAGGWGVDRRWESAWMQIICWRAVFVGVRENADFPLAQYLQNSWMGCCCGCEGKCWIPPKMSKKCILSAKVYILIPTLTLHLTHWKFVSLDTYLQISSDKELYKWSKSHMTGKMILIKKGRSERQDKTRQDTILAPGDKGLHPIIWYPSCNPFCSRILRMRRGNPWSWTSHRNTRGASRVCSCDESTIKDYYNSSVDSRTGRDYKRDVMYVSSQVQSVIRWITSSGTQFGREQEDDENGMVSWGVKEVSAFVPHERPPSVLPP